MMCGRLARTGARHKDDDQRSRVTLAAEIERDFQASPARLGGCRLRVVGMSSTLRAFARCQRVFARHAGETGHVAANPLPRLSCARRLAGAP
jgi:hypothetical protein